MKIYKEQIEFFKSYVSKDELRPLLKCLYLDLETLREEKQGDEIKRYAQLIGTNGFAMGGVEVELTSLDERSYYFPFEHLEVSKHYLKKSHEFITVEINSENGTDYNILFQTISGIILSIPSSDHGEFPNYKKVLKDKKEAEYVVRVTTKLMKDVVESHIKLGQRDIYIRMTGDKEPIFFKNFDNKITSLLMPATTEKEERGKLQK